MKNPLNMLIARVVGATTVELAWSTGETLRVDLADLPNSDLIRDTRGMRPVLR